jgi:hypothetical protein
MKMDWTDRRVTPSCLTTLARRVDFTLIHLTIGSHRLFQMKSETGGDWIRAEQICRRAWSP